MCFELDLSFGFCHLIFMLNWLFTQTPLVFLVQSIWRDEAFTYLLASKNVFQIIYYSAFDFSPPLYYLVVHVWMKIAGTSELALRAPSLMFYWATLYACYLYITDILNTPRRRALMYLIFIAINPLLVYYAFEARMYTMMSLLGVLSFYYFSKRDTKGYYWATLAGLFTHYFLIFVPLVHLAYTWLFDDAEARKKYFTVMKKIAYVFAPYFIIFLIVSRGGGSSFWLTKRPSGLTLPAFLYVGFDENMGFFKQYLMPLALVLWGILLWGARKMRSLKAEEKKLAYLLLMWFAMPATIIFALSFFKPLFLGRYLLFATMGFLLYLTLMISYLPRRLQAVILIALFFFSWRFNTLQIEHRTKPSLRVFREIKALARPSDMIYVASELNFHEAQYYLGEGRVFIYAKPHETIPTFVGKVLIPSSSIAHSLPTYPKRAFVVHSNLTYEIQSMY